MAADHAAADGILRNVETTAATSQTDMEDALQDFEALTVKWRDMVKLAQDLNERLTASSSPAAGSAEVMTTQAVEPEEATFIRSSLAQLGLQMANAPVTLDMVRDEHRWVDELARELAGVLQGSGQEGLMRRRGVVGLDEVWGGWNRARGVGAYQPAPALAASADVHIRGRQHSFPRRRCSRSSHNSRSIRTPRYACARSQHPASQSCTRRRTRARHSQRASSGYYP